MLPRADLDNLPEYVPGRSVPGAIKLASNEVPYGPLPGVAEAVAEAVASSHRYPDMGAVSLRDTLAQRLGGAPDLKTTGCGSGARAAHLAPPACRAHDGIAFAWRAFAAGPVPLAPAGA